MPLVQTIGTGRPLALASPSAKYAADLSSIRICNFRKPFSEAANMANEIGALREPGEITASVMPASINWRTTTRAREVDEFTSSNLSLEFHFRHRRKKRA